MNYTPAAASPEPPYQRMNRSDSTDRFLDSGYSSMTASTKDNKFVQVVQKFAPHSKLLRTWQLTGGVSAQVTALEIERPDGHTQKMMFRSHGEIDLKRNPHIAADEFRLLHLLHSANLATPMPYYLDHSSEIFSTPYLVIEYIEGTTEFAPSNVPNFLHQCATHLSSIHRVNCSQLDVSFLPQQATIYAKKLRNRPAQLDESLDEGHIRNVLEAAWPFPQHNPSVLLHGDFWPGNLLWQNGQLVAIIDWEDAALGDPLADLANSRLEILWAFGIDTMNLFTHCYQKLHPIDITNLPYWDLWAALKSAFQITEWATTSEALSEQTMRERHEWFREQAFEKVAVL